MFAHTTLPNQPKIYNFRYQLVRATHSTICAQFTAQRFFPGPKLRTSAAATVSKNVIKALGIGMMPKTQTNMSRLSSTNQTEARINRAADDDEQTNDRANAARGAD